MVVAEFLQLTSVYPCMLNLVFVGLFWGFWWLLTILNQFFVAMTISSRYYCKLSFVIIFMIILAFLGSVTTVILFSLILVLGSFLQLWCQVLMFLVAFYFILVLPFVLSCEKLVPNSGLITQRDQQKEGALLLWKIQTIQTKRNLN